MGDQLPSQFTKSSAFSGRHILIVRCAISASKSPLYAYALDLVQGNGLGLGRPCCIVQLFNPRDLPFLTSEKSTTKHGAPGMERLGTRRPRLETLSCR